MHPNTEIPLEMRLTNMVNFLFLGKTGFPFFNLLIYLKFLDNGIEPYYSVILLIFEGIYFSSLVLIVIYQLKYTLKM